MKTKTTIISYLFTIRYTTYKIINFMKINLILILNIYYIYKFNNL